jgi:acyl-CoA synthetase (NDP forming)/GNAT superfamily N-acetyltransferase
MSGQRASGDEVYALLSDGSTVLIRQAVPTDFAAVKAMHEQMSPGNMYLRFFSMSRSAPEREARRISRPRDETHAALLALHGTEVAGVASYEVERPAAGAPAHGSTSGASTADASTAEVAFAVAETMHHRGIATLLLEHLVSLARARGLTAFTAETLSENTSMLRVFGDAGLPVRTRRAEGVVKITIPLVPDREGKQLDDYLDTVARRERSSNFASLRPVFAPGCVAVIGASRRQASERPSVGRSVLDNVLAGGYAGDLYAVNPNASEIGGVPCFPDVASLPAAPDLALIAVPPPEVVDIAEECGKRGARGLVVLTAGLDVTQSADLLAACRRHGMRLIGPNCFGIAVPSIGLDATFGAASPRPGTAGLVMQSGGLGFAMVDHLTRLGIGISSFASVGNKLDVSSNDMLMWWEHDGVTELAVLYIESFGNPRKFARTARRASMRMPVLTVHAGRSAAGQAAAASHTAAVAFPLVTRQALFEQAGIIATPGFGELVEAVALFATQRPPAGRTVAIVSNVGGAGVLAADACTERGLSVHHPRATLRRLLEAALPAGAAIDGPVDTTAAVPIPDFRAVLEAIGADDDVDAVIAIVLPTGATGDLSRAIGEAVLDVPLAAVVLNQPEAVRVLPGPAGPVPAYGYPEAAAAALARAATYGEWRMRPAGTVPTLPDADPATARGLVRDFLSGTPDGGWLAPEQAATVLQSYGISLVPAAQARGDGIRVVAGVADEAMFGPLVTFGLGSGGADRVARLAPLTEADADAMVSSALRAHRDAPVADLTPVALAALRDLLTRISRLTDDVHEISELALDPVFTRPDGVTVAGAQVRAAPEVPHDPFLRRLRLPYVAMDIRRDIIDDHRFQFSHVLHPHPSLRPGARSAHRQRPRRTERLVAGR